MDVALHLDQRDGTGRPAAVGEPDGVGRVLPALVGAGRDRTGCGRRRSGRRGGRSSRAPPPGAAAGRAPPRRAGPSATRRAAGRSTAASRRSCRSRAAGGARADGVAARRRSCRILPGSSPVAGSVARPCVAGEGAQGAAREGDVVREQERGRPEGVAAEQGEVPGRARAREHVAGMAGLGEQQGVEVGEGAREQRGEARVVGAHGGGRGRAARSRAATTAAPVSCTDSDQLREASAPAGTVSGQREAQAQPGAATAGGRGHVPGGGIGGGASSRHGDARWGWIGTGSPHLIVSIGARSASRSSRSSTAIGLRRTG